MTSTKILIAYIIVYLLAIYGLYAMIRDFHSDLIIIYGKIIDIIDIMYDKTIDMIYYVE